MKQYIKYLKSRTVWMGIVTAGLSVTSALRQDNVVGLPIDEIEANKNVLVNQLTAMGTALAGVLAIFFRIHAKQEFKKER